MSATEQPLTSGLQHQVIEIAELGESSASGSEANACIWRRPEPPQASGLFCRRAPQGFPAGFWPAPTRA